MNVIREPIAGELWVGCKRCSGLGEVFATPRSLQLERCPSCRGEGIVVYRRGWSLVPLVSRRSCP